MTQIQVDVYWTLGGLMAWVMFRDLKYAQEFTEENKSAAVLGVLGALPRQHDDAKTKPTMSFSQAQKEILSQLRKGYLTSSGMRSKHAFREEIPSLEWINNVFSLMPDAARISPEFGYSPHPTWVHLRFSSSQAIGIWPVKSAPALLTPSIDIQYMFARHGSKWFLAFAGESVWVDHRVGMTYLQHLLRNPNEEFWALGLAQLTSKPGVELFTPDILEVDGSSFDHVTPNLKSPLPLLDKLGIASMYQRLAQLKECLARAEEFGIPEEVAAAQDELDGFFVEFNKATNHKGQSRNFSGAAENARISVSKALKRAKTDIETGLPDLYEHLESAVTIGHQCVYAPREKLNWVFLLESNKKN